MKKVLSLVAVMGLLSFVGCDGGDGDSNANNSIVGTWNSASANGVETTITGASLTFHSNGSLTAQDRTGAVQEDFAARWSTNGNQLTLIPMDADSDTSISTFSISGNTLTITDAEAGTLTFTRA